jgi:putative ABC transport system ATP-binding protein
VLHLENIKKTEPTIAHNPENIITLRNVSKYYVNQYMAFKVLKNVDLEVPMGKFVVILGPSGSGKTTLLNIISGMDNATYGDVVIANESLINKRGSALTVFRKNNIGYVFQQYGLLPNLTV